MIELRKCPNPECKGPLRDPRLEDHDNYSWVRFECERCGTCGPRVDVKDFDSLEEAVDEAGRLWNLMPRSVDAGRKAELIAALENFCDLTEEFGLEIWSKSTVEILRRWYEKEVAGG